MDNTILLVDDNDSIAEAISLILSQLGYQVLTADNCQKAGQLLKCYRPSLVLLDVHFPGEQGDVFCMRLKKNHLTKDLPIYLISSDINLPLICRTCGADGFLVKPFQMEELMEIVEKTCPLPKNPVLRSNYSLSM